MAELAREAELLALSDLVGVAVVAAERSPWGFENRTDIVTLADGRRLVVQRITRLFSARRRLLLARAVPPLLASVGIQAPRLLTGDAECAAPFAIREYLAGETANLLLGNEEGALVLAQAMGALLPLIAAAPVADVPLPDLWATPERLADESRRRLDDCQALIDRPVAAALAQVITELPTLFAGRAPVFAHGDYCPVNALVAPLDADPPRRWSVVGLVDFDESRLADPLFDAAWWGWVVRSHHPERWAAAWTTLLAAAGIEQNAPTMMRVRSLQLLRLLEALDEARTSFPTAAGHWCERLHLTTSWA